MIAIEIIKIVLSQIVSENQSTTLCIPLEDIPQDIAPDMRTPDSLMRALEDKEQKLALLLNLNMNTEPAITEIGKFLSFQQMYYNLWLSRYLSLCKIEFRSIDER